MPDCAPDIDRPPLAVAGFFAAARWKAEARDIEMHPDIADFITGHGGGSTGLAGLKRSKEIEKLPRFRWRNRIGKPGQLRAIGARDSVPPTYTTLPEEIVGLSSPSPRLRENSRKTRIPKKPGRIL